jgi:hypothetical protein
MRSLRKLAMLSGWLLAACASSTTTRPAKSWKNVATPSLRPTHTMVAFMTTDFSTRRVVEDRLAARLPGAVASYRLIPNSELLLIDAVIGRLVTFGYDGIVVVRLAPETARPTASGTDFYTYWDHWRNAYDADSSDTSVLYALETTLYSVHDRQMIWLGRSEPMQQPGIDKLEDYSVDFAADNIRESGLIR